MSSIPKRVGNANLMEQFKTDTEFMLDRNRLPAEPKFSSKSKEEPEWSDEHQRFDSRSLPKSLTSSVKSRLMKVLREETTDTVELRKYEDLQNLLRRLSIKFEIESHLIGYDIVDGSFFEDLEEIDWRQDRLSTGKQPSNEQQKRRRYINSIKFYISQRAAEFFRAIPIQLECVEELLWNTELSKEDLTALLRVSLEDSVHRLWWLYNLEVPVKKDAEFSV